ncbi:MAG TPA: LysM peptidoglycan-binding domain-containing protein, partial [Coxiellaceae bacterium]|nr:LysM peptidoglycan-binding domain-containing protein [Coxiellaceae bacterium]
GSVQNAIDYNKRMNKPTDFWSLALPAETHDYFPKLIALANIIMNAKHYQVQLPYVPDQPYFESVTLHSQATLEQLAKMARVSESVIQRLNPAFRRWATEPNNEYPILIPASRVAYFKQELERWTGRVELSWMYHQARGGETLAKIAKNYHTKLDLLAKINGLKENSFIKTNESLLVPVRLHRRFNVVDQQAIYNNQVAQPVVQHASFDVPTKVSVSDSLEQILNKLQDSEVN